MESFKLIEGISNITLTFVSTHTISFPVVTKQYGL